MPSAPLQRRARGQPWLLAAEPGLGSHESLDSESVLSAWQSRHPLLSREGRGNWGRGFSHVSAVCRSKAHQSLSTVPPCPPQIWSKMFLLLGLRMGSWSFLQRYCLYPTDAWLKDFREGGHPRPQNGWAEHAWSKGGPSLVVWELTRLQV